MLGTSTFANSKMAEITNISPFGFWLLINNKEYFVDFDDYPVFEDAPVLDVASVEVDAAGNLHWPSLDADIELDALENPSGYPLSYK